MIPWYQRLTTKVVVIGAAFFAIICVLLWMHYSNEKSELIESNRNSTEHNAKFFKTTLLTFLLKTEQGGGLIDGFLEKTNAHMGYEAVRIVHSAAINFQYGEEEDEQPRNKLESRALLDGKPAFYEDENYFNYVLPIKAIKGCPKCHDLPGKPGVSIPVGYTLALAITRVPTAPMKDQLVLLRDESIKLLLAMALLIVAIALFLNRYITSPLAGMLRVIQKVTDGMLSERVKLKQSDEIGRLGENFNLMAEQLQKSFKSLENWNEQLQQEVARKTSKVREQANHIRSMRDHYMAIIDSAIRVIYTTDKNLIIDSVNAEWDTNKDSYKMKLGREDILGKNLLDFISGDEKDNYREIFQSILNNSGQSDEINRYNTEFKVKIDDKEKFFGLSISPLITSEGQTEGLVFVSYDISQRKRSEQMLRLEKEKLDGIMNAMGAGVSIIDENRKIIYTNRIMADTFGTEIIGRKCHEVITGNPEHCKDCMGVQTKDVSNMELKAESGRTYIAIHSPVMDIDGKKSMVEVLEDITYLKSMEENLRELTITDNLTGLFNRRHFIYKLDDEIARAKRQKTPLTLLFADIDKFKSYNDTYGHVEGDKCLAVIGEIVASSTRNHVDSGFRYGGEEFTVIMPGADVEIAKRIANRIRTTFEAHGFTPEVDGKTVEVHKTISIGVADFKPESGKGADQFIKMADDAMYRAKKAGGNRVEVDGKQ